MEFYILIEKEGDDSGVTRSVQGEMNYGTWIQRTTMQSIGHTIVYYIYYNVLYYNIHYYTV